ncbi:MAG: site-specific integrase [Lachnospiraceae bacterium]|nr:site-specific integrase [Lachnospiraceae bacterium]MCM1238121.1 site-specific integrase [Lachnospiraceae bacterium]
MSKYSSILKKIQETSCAKMEWGLETFYLEVVKGIFVKCMGYESRDSCVKECVNAFQIKDVLIMGSVEKRAERGFAPLIQQMKTDNCNWGVLVHTAGIWLINLDITPDTSRNFTSSQVVLEIVYGMNTDQKYFQYFSAENTIGEKKNACFFRDITDYKNNQYKGKEKSWPAYESALKRFFDFYVEHKGDYGYKENVYESIQFPYFVEFIKKGTRCNSILSARNSFFYIKDFMQAKSGNGEFDDPGRVNNSFPEFLPKYDTQDIMCIDKLKAALDYLSENRNGIRNKTVLLFLLAYGMERRKLCALKWEDIHFGDRQIKMNKKKYPMPTYLLEMLVKLKKQDTPGKYVFSGNNGEVLGEGAINTILSGIAKADVNDRFYSQLTPANIRRCLARYLLEHDYPMQKMFYLLDMDGYKLGSYISIDDIEKTFWKESQEPIVCLVGQHPMEGFLERLREPSERQEGEV